jgi:O-antigen/teichoic acid export membrane protein
VPTGPAAGAALPPSAAPGHDRRSLREIAGGSFVSILGFSLQQFLQYALFVAISRFWGASGLGLFATGQAILWVGGGVFRLGLSNGTVRYVAMLRGTPREGGIRRLLRGVNGVAFASSLLGGALLYATAGLIGRFLSKPDLVPLLKIFAFGVPFWNLLFIATFAIQGFRHMNWMVTVRNLAQPGVALLAVAAAGFLGAGLADGTLAYVASVAAVLALGAFVVRRLAARAPDADPPLLREVLFFSFPLIWTQLVAYGVRQQETLILAYFMAAADVGVYNAALKTAVMVGFILQGTTAIFTPIIAPLHRAGDLDQLRRLNRTVARWCFTFALPCFWVCALFGRQILSLWGHRFEEAWPVLVLLAAAQLVNVATGTAGTVLIMGERQKIELANSIAALVLGLVLDVLLIPRYGIVGAAVGACASMTAVNVLRVIQIQRLWQANPINALYLKPLVAGLAAAAAAWGTGRLLASELGLGAWPVMLGGCVTLVVVYAAGLWLLGLEADDVAVARGFLRRLRGARPRGGAGHGGALGGGPGPGPGGPA